LNKSDRNFVKDARKKSISRFFENIMGSGPSEKVGVAVDLKGHAISSGKPCFIPVCHSDLLGIFPLLFKKDSRRALLAGMTTWRIISSQKIADYRLLNSSTVSPAWLISLRSKPGPSSSCWGMDNVH
jgi:hypothetical protein